MRTARSPFLSGSLSARFTSALETIPLATIIAGMPNGGDANASDVGVMTGMFPTMCAPGYDGDEEGATEATCANCGGDCSKTDSEPSLGGISHAFL